HGLQNVEGPDNAIVEVARRLIVTVDNVRIGRKMPNQFVVLNLFHQQLTIQNVGLQETDVRLGEVPLDKLDPAVRQVVVDGDPNASIRKKVEDMAADEARPPGQENSFNVRGNQRRSLQSHRMPLSNSEI